MSPIRKSAYPEGAAGIGGAGEEIDKFFVPAVALGKYRSFRHAPVI